MDKNAIKKYAVWARRELISRVSQKALQYGISEKEIVPASAASVNGVVLSAEEIKQRKALIEQINAKGYEQVMEEVAYTWFNRFIALRFMEVNGYLPSHVRVFTDEDNAFRPQIITEAINLELDGLDMDKVYAWKDANDNDSLFKYLIITQCNALSPILPRMFQRIADYTELLFPDNLLREGSVIARLIEDISENDFNIREENGGIEIIGWLYQYYISEKHEEVIDPLHGKVTLKEDVPAATQLFTTDWVVRYIVDNTIGRYWIERNPNSNLQNELEYLVLPQNGILPTVHEVIKPQDVTVFDPCVGSGHFLVYAFEVLLKIYVEYGYTEREAAREILQHNLFGLDIDNRAAQLAYFAVMMKARQYDRLLFRQGIVPHIHTIIESNSIDSYAIGEFCAIPDIRKDVQLLMETFRDSQEYGSILQIPNVDFVKLDERVEEMKDYISLTAFDLNTICEIVRVAKIMSGKYAAVVTNPPYLGKYDDALKKFILDNYKDYSGDLFGVFMYRNFAFCRTDGYTGFMTPNVWMFIQSYEKLRRLIVEQKQITSLVQMAKGAFYREATVDVCAFVMQNNHREGVNGDYVRLENFKGDMSVQDVAFKGALRPDCDYRYQKNQQAFSNIPGYTIAYWINDELINIFKTEKTLMHYAEARVGLQTGENNLFLRQWFEVRHDSICFNASSNDDAQKSGQKWFPYNKGGAYRKWFGNNDYVVNWQDDGYEIKHFFNEKGKLKSRPQNTQYYFRPSITWSYITSGDFSARIKDTGFIFDVSGVSLFINDRTRKDYILGLLCSTVAAYITGVINPTLNMQVGDIQRIPIVMLSDMESVARIVRNCIQISREDWDSFEISWHFTKHPLIMDINKISEAYKNWEDVTEQRYQALKSFEEELNEVFIKAYNLSDELTAAVQEKSVSVCRAERAREIRSFISYAVGCMFGRYSLDIPGLAYAGGEWDDSKYTTFKADKDSIIPICDDEYFADDIVGRFIRFIEVVYGKETLQENLRFIADALGGNGQPKDVIRNYFLNDFYADHLKVYQKRPIYWLFDSGKKNGFKALVYMHRYPPDTIARMRTDYVHEQQARYRTAIADLEQRIASASTAERVKLSKRLKTLQEQATEIQGYEEKIHHLADQYIAIDLDDGVKKNYAIFGDVLAKIK